MHLQLMEIVIYSAVFSWMEMGNVIIKRGDIATFLFYWNFFENVFISETLCQSDSPLCFVAY